MEFTTIFEAIYHFASIQPEKIAILAPGRKPLTYEALFDQVVSTKNQLIAFGVSETDPIAIVLPNGPSMAVAFIAVANTALSAPLNPSYRKDEFNFYLNDLGAKAIIYQGSHDAPIVQASTENQIPILHLEEDPLSPAGTFQLRSNQEKLFSTKKNNHEITDDHICLVLHTSGTTSRPKIVPLTQINLSTSASNIRDWLQLNLNDRCLNIMPLFHIHGLVAAVLASLFAGGSIVCTEGHNSVKFFEWMDEFSPTWYTAVPTMHQAILQRASEYGSVISNKPLRFVRSSSSSLPPQVMNELMETFSAPVVEAYGMTEASHQMTCNPLPPGKQRPGSVGLPAGPEVAIMSESSSDLLPKGDTGEIVIRGENVTHGYLNNPPANQKSFTDGWFRTGDQGYFAQDGYLFITGRLKEIINRGGEKISPREIDEVLMDHPAVNQAIAFSVPDSELGEEIAAAVVSKDPNLTEIHLRRFLAEKLVEFKIPRRILILDEIPKGPTGKLQRIGLAEKFGLRDLNKNSLNLEEELILPGNKLEKDLADIWRKVLGLETIYINQRFTDLGGDSALALILARYIQEVFSIEVVLFELYEAETISQQVQLLSPKISKH